MAVATLREDLFQGFWRGLNERARGSAKKGEEGEEKVQQIRGVSGTNSTFTGLKLIICQRAEEIGEKGGGTEGFESGHDILVKMPIMPKGGGEDEVLVHFGGFFALGLDIVMEGKDRDAFVVQVGEEERRESPGSFAVVDVLYDQETVGKLCFLSGLEVGGPCVQVRALFVNVGMIFLSILRVMKCIRIHE